MPMVERVARDVRWMFAPHLELDDLTQAGNLGLVRAANAYEPAKASRNGFEPYAYFRVRGAIIDSQKRRAYREEANVSLQALVREDGWLPPSLDRDPRPLPSEVAERDQISRILAAALDELPEIEGRVLRAQLEGQPVRAVARAVGMSPTWTRQKVKRGAGEGRGAVLRGRRGMTTALAIKTIRALYGESQWRFANRLNIQIRALSRYEAGDRVGNLRVLYWLFREGVYSANDEMANSMLALIFERLDTNMDELKLLEPWFVRLFSGWPKPPNQREVKAGLYKPSLQ